MGRQNNPIETASDARRRLRTLALGAIGVVFGDIGTSPLYTMKETLGTHGMTPTEPAVLGVLSLVFWSLIMVVSLKYVTFVMRADNKGEGGIMALMALAQRSMSGSARARWVLAGFGIFGAALFYGDGVITPAISVLGAVEGLQVAAPGLGKYVVWIALAILLGMFAVQRHGTHKVGKAFAPVMTLWFVVLAVLGVRQIIANPQVLYAINPLHAVRFFLSHGNTSFIALGGVVLALTGAEALYADMGHFGKKPIRLAWFGFVLPALLLNYFGQGALLLADPLAISSPFYLMVPESLLYPMIVLSAAAAVIASQAVISGAFSMTREAMSLGYSPRLAVVHTSREMSGQIFVPWVNRMLMVLVILAVLGFRSSDNLGAAYGIAVTGTMTMTTLLALVVARKRWHWSWLTVVLVGVLFLIIDLSFFGANLLKVAHGGWFPLVLGVVLFTVMTTWRRGRELVVREIKQGGLALAPFIENIAEHPPLRVPGTAIFLTANQHAVPHALLHNLKHNKVLHERNVLLTVETLETPVAEADERIAITPMAGNFFGLELRFGFAEDPNIPLALTQCTREGLGFDMMDTTFFLSRETIVADARRPGMALWRDKLFAFLSRNAMPATAFFQIPGNRLIELGAQVEI
ncbi:MULTISPECIES: potassium transporter Kup [Rhodanobacter]|uniref:Probable potassium transport system protein Kup n=1 Tax=Rhodanobacter denitrificans TaxID=666685 RepID=M4NJA2_9GAMM|nr:MULTISPECIES: potassium transporter Kup [Rhodanobacter]AGG87881.1 K+ transporter [Rhodanobacter denitrificans]KZC21443.1 potassium transport protein Kup [Rhodanobacter denitrificans]UJJ51783.1 potassium transporter Kup [Rhodanobacter denitrificans]UJJ59442.1 potassium transporter Kup [Rhodanobacter denitrificans]UJM87039.1 potassium transporter Kup [Rhodanobacter denitrificans]